MEYNFVFSTRKSVDNYSWECDNNVWTRRLCSHTWNNS